MLSFKQNSPANEKAGRGQSAVFKIKQSHVFIIKICLLRPDRCREIRNVQRLDPTATFLSVISSFSRHQQFKSFKKKWVFLCVSCCQIMAFSPDYIWFLGNFR